MLGWFRRRRAARLAPALIAEAIAAHALYEVEHSERMGHRLKGHGPDHEKHDDQSRHGRYAPDQTVIAVYQRVVRALHQKKLPPHKTLLVDVQEALRGVDADS